MLLAIFSYSKHSLSVQTSIFAILDTKLRLRLRLRIFPSEIGQFRQDSPVGRTILSVWKERLL